MGSVLAFAPRDAAAVRKPLVTGGTASVVIFPGIRYERHGEAAVPGTPPVKRDTQREKPRH